MAKSKKKKPTKPKKAVQETSTKTPLFWLLGILVLTLLSMIPVFQTEFINYDDNLYITENHLITGFDIAGLFSQIYEDQYSPFSMLLMALKIKTFGLSAGALKAFSVLIHLINTFLVFRLMRLLFNAPTYAYVVALLFGVHTMQVESVAWLAASFKVGYYTLFFLGALIFYINYLNKKGSFYYALSIVFFVLSCLSKEQAVAFSVTLFAVDYLRERNLFSKQVILEKIPFLLISLGFGILTLIASEVGEGQTAIANSYSFFERVIFTIYAFGAYWLTLLLPVNLSFFYYYPEQGSIPAYYYGYIIFILLFLAGLWYAIKQNQRVLVFALVFFLINIGFPLVTQLLAVRVSIMADRYIYIPLIGFGIIIAWGVLQLGKKGTFGKYAMYGVGAYALLLAALSFNRAGDWKNSITIFDDVIEKQQTKGKCKAALSSPYTQVGIAYRGLKKADKALTNFSKAVECDPKDASALANRGNIFFDRNQNQEALADYNKALAIDPNNKTALSSSGAIYARTGQTAIATERLNKAIKLHPNFPGAYRNRGTMHLVNQDYANAIPDFQKFLSLRPNDVIAVGNLAFSYHHTGNYDNAIRFFDLAINMSPNNGEYHLLRSYSYTQKGNKAKALQDAQRARQLGHIVEDSYLQSLQ